MEEKENRLSISMRQDDDEEINSELDIEDNKKN